MRCLLGGPAARQQVRRCTQPLRHSDELLSSCVCSTSSFSSTATAAAAVVQASKLTDATTMAGNNALGVSSQPCSVMPIILPARCLSLSLISSLPVCFHDAESAACGGDTKRATRTEIVAIARRSLKVSSGATSY